MLSRFGNWSGPPQGDDDDDGNDGSSGDSLCIDNLNIKVDHFQNDQDARNSLESLATAIESCRQEVLETDENTEKRKELVQRLINLRICHQDLVERLEKPPQKCIETRGHVFVNYHDQIPGAANSRQLYCQQCSDRIWVSLQSSQHCQDCGFSVHSTCMDNIVRECVARKVRTLPDFIMQICPERTLLSLKFRCVECDKLLSWSNDIVRREPRLCDYTGLWFCPDCHWNAKAVSPARIIHNWDFDEYPVSQATKQYLFLMYKKPVINVEKINPKLFAAVPDLNQIRSGRNRLMYMKKYLMVCRFASEQKLLLQLADRQHFVDDPNYYSLQDLSDVHSGKLLEYMEEKLKLFADHILGCVLCQAKGFFCEICNLKKTDKSSLSESLREFAIIDCPDEVLFPFEDKTKTCDRCFAVYHKLCFEKQECPKCKRRESRRSQVGREVIAGDDDEKKPVKKEEHEVALEAKDDSEQDVENTR